MLVDIDKIVVGNRIRKDFGDIQELADNIKKNGLLNPLTVNGDYKLLAGERRLKACKLLGWSQVDVRMVKSEDEAQDIDIELSENNVRRNFSGSELAEGIRRQMDIEAEKARERMAEGGRSGKISLPSGQARDKAGEHFGISGKQAQKVVFVDEHSNLLDPDEFAKWDEGKLSTNKAFQKIKAAQQQAEHDRKVAEMERDAAKSELAEAYHASELMEAQVASLKKQVAQKPKPEVIEREVVREVVPSDYEDLKRRNRELENGNRIYNEDYQRVRKSNEELRKELDRAKDLLGMDKTLQDVRKDVQYLIASTNQYIRRYGGLTWTAASLSQVDKQARKELKTAATNLATFASALVASLESIDEQ